MVSFIGKTTEDIRTWLREHHLLNALEQQICSPLIPLPDNFTAPTRTPWGGTKILGKYKQGLQIRPEQHYPVVGESWEISADPEAPCQFVFDLAGQEILMNFIQLLDLFPEQILGQQVAAKFNGQNPILVKFLDAADNLSVQVHPSDSYEGLQPDESGKPESWYILEAEPGTGLYFGLKEGITKDSLRHVIEQQENVSQDLNFVEVHPGDFFVIDAGTIHAIGAGVTLIEPQKIAPKKSGKTYRLWDWNRTYDEHGRPDPNGKPRELHVEDSLQVINFGDPRGDEFVKHIRCLPQTVQQNRENMEILLTETENFGVSQIMLEHGDELIGNCEHSFHGIVVTKGCMKIYKQDRKIAEIFCGQSVILPSMLQQYTLRGKHAQGVKVYYPERYL